ncbi:hypothetical protein PTNB29_06687 [Pyrenophora teres f. teres]|nr:hypothetical protein PTNB29_06687 [Pyrenophora teres f. teres]
MHCSICTRLAKVLKPDTDTGKDQPLTIRAYLKETQFQDYKRRGRAFTLDLELGSNRSCTFLLAEIVDDDYISSRYQTRKEDLEMVQDWMKSCKCARSWDEPGEKWYPRRLLDLEELRTHSDDAEEARIRLIESEKVLFSKPADVEDFVSPSYRQNNRYVTLSHCWGKQRPNHAPLKLTFDTESRFKNEGIELKELPKTFRDAVLFASRLEKMKSNWEIATASPDGHKGLFFDQRPEHVWGDKVNVYFPEYHPYISRISATAELDPYTRCMVVDISAWDDLVELAPVNQRGWVFQERLLAPRVLHFCHNQLAWECSDFSTTEAQSNLQLPIKIHRDGIYQEGRLKDLTPSVGRKFREPRLRGMPDPDEHVEDLYIYELWKRVIETYSRTHLSYVSDRLIALAGIARLFRDKLFTSEPKPTYIAGLWDKHIESQLLWQVNEVYKGNGVFDTPAKRHPMSGPSFSWAAIESPHGITYGDVTDYASSYEYTNEELLFKVLHHSIKLADPKNPFGIVKSGHVLLAPRHLRQIELYKLCAPQRLPYAWRLKLDPQLSRPLEHFNILLDAPNTDTDIFAENAEIYCMPAAYSERTVCQDNFFSIFFSDDDRIV